MALSWHKFQQTSETHSFHVNNFNRVIVRGKVNHQNMVKGTLWVTLTFRG